MAFLDADDRAREYLDSPLMTQRLVYKRQLSARIEGIYGAYRTSVRLVRRKNGSCTCPSDEWPCKHVRALRMTWDVNPESFFDLASFLKILGRTPKEDLVVAIRELVLAFPEGLGVLGVREFVSYDEDDDVEVDDA